MGNQSLLYEVDEPLTDLGEYGFSDWGTDGDFIGSTWAGYESDPAISSDSSEWLRNTGSQLNENGQSFFLAVNFINPHDVMYFQTQEGYDKSSQFDLLKAPDDQVYEKTYDTNLPSTWNQDLSKDDIVPALSFYKEHWNSQTGTMNGKESCQELQDYYFNCIQDSDNNIMNLLTTLKDLDMFDNTIIVFTSDHGEMQAAHSLKGKGGFIYENNVHVPLIICHPDYEGGKTVDAVTSHMDLAPTFIDMTNISSKKKEKAAEGLAGNSLMPLLSGAQDSVRSGALFCFEMLSFTADISVDKDGNVSYDMDHRGFVRAIFTDRYKFARYFTPDNFNTPETFEDLIKNNDLELYDLKTDPEECNNLAADPEENKELIMKMNSQLNKLIKKEIGVDNGSEFKEMLTFYQKESGNRQVNNSDE